MKTAIRNFSTLAIAFTLILSATAMANDKKENPTATSTIALKFIGNVQNQPVFELNLANAEADEFFIVIRDEYGNLLYSAREKGSNITRKFMLNEEMGDTNLYFEVKSKKNNKTETYKISKSYSYKDEPVITSAK
jgi:hypothetical protein